MLPSGCWSTDALDSSVRRTILNDATPTLANSTNTITDAVAEMHDSRKLPAQLNIDLNAALRLATQYSRSLQSKREQLYLSGLDVLAATRQFEPQCSGTLDYVLNKDSDGNTSRNGGLGLKSSVILPTGGKLSAAAGTQAAMSNSFNSATYDTTANIELRQPLLAGAGYEASHEPLTQARHGLVYALRSFALERQDFSIGIMENYYNLVIQKAVLENTRLNVEQATYLRKRSEALFKIRRAPSIDVLRAQQQELTARNGLLQTESDYEIGLSRFLIEAGLPVSIQLKAGTEVPVKKPLSLNKDTCIKLALERRLDLKTMQEKLDDSQRRLRLARNALLPQVDVFGKSGTREQGTDAPGGGAFDSDYAAGISMEIPLDKRDERDAIKKSMIEVAASERNVTEKRDTIRVEISDSFSKLEALSETVVIEGRNIEIAQRRADYATFRFRNGELSNRDVVEAQNDLLNARNAHVRALVQYERQRVQLLRDVGLLDVAADGTLIELPVPASGKQ